jgi:hypothetical protein
MKLITWLRKQLKEQYGISIVKGLVTGAVGLVVIGAILPALWPTIVGSGTSIAALTQTDAGTVTMKAIWPITIIIVGIGAGIMAIMYVIKKFKIGQG